MDHSELFELNIADLHLPFYNCSIFSRFSPLGRIGNSSNVSATKGQIISEGNLGVFKSPKKQAKFFEGFLP